MIAEASSAAINGSRLALTRPRAARSASPSLPHAKGSALQAIAEKLTEAGTPISHQGVKKVLAAGRRVAV